MLRVDFSYAVEVFTSPNDFKRAKYLLLPIIEILLEHLRIFHFKAGSLLAVEPLGFVSIVHFVDEFEVLYHIAVEAYHIGAGLVQHCLLEVIFGIILVNHISEILCQPFFILFGQVKTELNFPFDSSFVSYHILHLVKYVGSDFGIGDLVSLLKQKIYHF